MSVVLGDIAVVLVLLAGWFYFRGFLIPESSHVQTLDQQIAFGGTLIGLATLVLVVVQVALIAGQIAIA